MIDDKTTAAMYVHPEGKDSAFCTELVLRDDGTHRLIFRGRVTRNEQDENLPVFGEFVYQKKAKGAGSFDDPWKDDVQKKINSMPPGCGTKLALKTAELDKIVSLWHSLNTFYKTNGIPTRRTLLPLVGAVGSVGDMPLAELEGFCREHGSDSLAKLIAIAAGRSDLRQTLLQLERLSATSLERLNTLSGIVTLKNALDLWNRNSQNSDEDFWQQELEKNAFLFSQVFSTPAVFFRDKPYVGGKGLGNDGGKYPDFLFKSLTTGNTLFVELKTPATPLLGSLYRTDVFPPSQHTAGAVAQVLRYKEQILKNFFSLKDRTESEFRALSPQCLVVAGRIDSLKTRAEIESFELFRNNLRECSVITYDELFGKTKMLVDLLEGPESIIPAEEAGEAPF